MKQQCQDTVKRGKHQAGKYKQTLTNCYVVHSKGKLVHCVLLEKVCFQKKHVKQLMEAQMIKMERS